MIAFNIFIVSLLVSIDIISAKNTYKCNPKNDKIVSNVIKCSIERWTYLKETVQGVSAQWIRCCMSSELVCLKNAVIRDMCEVYDKFNAEIRETYTTADSQCRTIDAEITRDTISQKCQTFTVIKIADKTCGKYIPCFDLKSVASLVANRTTKSPSDRPIAGSNASLDPTHGDSSESRGYETDVPKTPDVMSTSSGDDSHHTTHNDTDYPDVHSAGSSDELTIHDINDLDVSPTTEPDVSDGPHEARTGRVGTTTTKSMRSVKSGTGPSDSKSYLSLVIILSLLLV